jgi:MFS family permease
VSLVLQRETYSPAILEGRARRLRKETGNLALRSALKSPKTPKQLFVLSIIRPTKILLLSPIVFIFSVITAIVYGTIYLLFTTMPQVFEEQYGISKSNVGLTYLAMGMGQIMGVIIFGMVSDRILKRLSKGGEMKPEFRLPPLLVGLTLLGIGLLWYGWAAEYAHAWIVPLLGQVLIGVGVITAFMPVTTYLVDAFVSYAASATAANTVLRSLGGALLPLAGPKMYAALGLGWGNTLLAFIALGCVPFAWWVFKFGERIRNRYQLNL